MSLDYTHPTVSLFVASPRKGKTNCIKHQIMVNSYFSEDDKTKFQFGIVITGSKFNNDYKYIPEDYVFEWDDHEEALENYLNTLQQMKEDYGKIPPNFVIYDDTVGLMSKFDGQLNNFFSVHRHYNCHVFIAVQHLNTGSSTLLREITTRCFMFSASGFNTIKSLFESFGQKFEKFPEFRSFFLEHTKEDYTALVYDDEEERFFTFRAPDMSDVNVTLEY